LYYYPERDEPGWRHEVKIRPPAEGQDPGGWAHLVKEDRVVSGR